MSSKRDELIQAISDVVETTVTEATELAGTERWDSLAVVVVISAIDQLGGRRPRGEDLARCITVGDVIKLAGF